MQSARWLAIVLVLAVAAAACGGGRGSSDDAATPTASPTDQPETEETESAESAEEAASAEETGDATEPVEPELPLFGEAPWPCGPGDASGETEQGVTNETITIGVGDDRGFPTSPGLNKDMTDALVAAIDVCNKLGGINGRIVEPNVYDAAVFNAGQVIIEACDQVFV